MKRFRQAALAAALMLTAGTAGSVPGGTVHAQGRSSLVRAFDVGRGSRLGVSVSDLDDSDVKDAKQAKAGVVTESVEPGSAAEKAGIKAGDVITEFDGEKVRSVRQFSRLVQETPSGRAVAIAVSRGGQRLVANATVERASYDDDFALRLLETPMARPAMPPPQPPEPPRAPRAPSPGPALPFNMFRLSSGRRLGVSLETLDEQLAQYFGVKEGALVRSVEKDSAAEKAGVKAGDVITSINGRQIYEASDVNRAVERMDDRGDITLEIVRDRTPQTLKGKLEVPPASRGSVMTF